MRLSSCISLDLSDGICLYGYISMGGHIIPEAEKANMDAFAKPLSTSYTCFHLFQSLHKIGNLAYHR